MKTLEQFLTEDVDTTEDVQIIERDPFQMMAVMLSKVISQKDYKSALDDLIQVIKRKGTGRHDPLYYASQVAKTYKGVDARALHDLYMVSGHNVNEELSTTASTTTAGVDTPDPPNFKVTRFLGKPCIEVDGKTYAKCMRGKIPYERWIKYTEDESLRAELKKFYRTRRGAIIKDGTTGYMAYFK